VTGDGGGWLGCIRRRSGLGHRGWTVASNKKEQTQAVAAASTSTQPETLDPTSTQISLLA